MGNPPMSPTSNLDSRSEDSSRLPAAQSPSIGRDKPSPRQRPGLSLSHRFTKDGAFLPLSDNHGTPGKSPEHETSQQHGEDGHGAQDNRSGNADIPRRHGKTHMALNLNRSRLTRDINADFPNSPSTPGMDRFPAIVEETSAGLSTALGVSIISPSVTGAPTTSTESNQTIRGSRLQTPAANQSATPAYPFPPMNGGLGTPTNAYTPGLHKPFTALSPTVIPPAEMLARTRASRDRLVSGHTTPSSMSAFVPSRKQGWRGSSHDVDPDLSGILLRLNSDPGLEQWWSNLTQDLYRIYGAERATLAVPSDVTDVENVPWAQMACFRNTFEDPFSQETNDPQSSQSSLYESSNQGDMVMETIKLTRTESEEAGKLSRPGDPTQIFRPKLESRHSFAGFAHRTQSEKVEYNGSVVKARRPTTNRTGSHNSLRGGRPSEGILQGNVKLSAASLQRHETSEEFKGPRTEDMYKSRRPPPGRILNVLQPLESEADPLLTSAGALHVLERCKTAVLTREYFDESQPIEQTIDRQNLTSVASRRNWPTPKRKMSVAPTMPGAKPLKAPLHAGSIPLGSLRRPQSQTSGSSGSSSAPHSSVNDTNGTVHRTVPYEDYEQMPASPWSQSPAPSPAIQADPDANPFFVQAVVDEDAFAENPPQHDYTADQDIEAIGVDRASSVVHIPLIHPLFSQPKRPQRLRAEARTGIRSDLLGERFSTATWNHLAHSSLASSDSDRRTPIAILSILSSTVPYPHTLTASLKDIAPHLATSFYNARQHSSLQREVAGLSRHRYGCIGDTALRIKSRPGRVAGPTGLIAAAAAEDYYSPPNTGSTTSASEYSGISKQSPRYPFTGGSQVGTPGDTEQAGQQPAESSVSMSSDGYFAPNNGFDRTFGEGNLASVTADQNACSEVSSTQRTLSDGPDDLQWDPAWESARHLSDLNEVKTERSKIPVTDARSLTPNDPSYSETKPIARLQTGGEPSTKREKSSPTRNIDNVGSARRQDASQPSSQGHHRPERQTNSLHTHGADIRVMHPSLPVATLKIPPAGYPSGGLRTPREVDYMFENPTPNMLRLMIDNGATQQFIAKPDTGLIVWANSKLLSFRNQPASEIHEHPWGNMHYKDQRVFRKLWAKALQTGEQMSHQVRLRRFDGEYRWFHIRVLPLRNKHSVITHWHGQAMDIHDQHVAEVDAAREKEKAASEAKYRSLANSNPLIIFAASVPNGMTFANTQWLSYSGQSLEDTLGFGFLQHVHPEDLVKCRFPAFGPQFDFQSSDALLSPDVPFGPQESSSSSTDGLETVAISETTMKAAYSVLEPDLPSSGLQAPNALLRDLVRDGVIKCSKDVQGRLSITTEMRLRSRTDEYRWHIVQGSLIESVNFGQGDAQWYIACADISDQKQSEASLKEACDTLEKETRRKMEYLSSMSHEIRTPLNGIIGNLQFLLNSGLDDFQSDWTFGAHKAAEGMHTLINDILDVSKAEAKMLKLFFDWFNVRSIVEDAVETLNSKATEKGLELCYEVAASVPSSVKGDAGRIKQVLLNLIGNAIKFTQRGEIWVNCEIKETEERWVSSQRALESNEIFLQFSVKDTGSGFAEEDKKLLFKPYSQIDNSNTRSNGGTGLGLILCKNMVELHGGEIDAVGKLGKGSEFTFFARFNIRESNDQINEPGILALSSSTSIKMTPQTVATHLHQANAAESPNSPRGLGGSDRDSPALQSSASSDPSVGSVTYQRSLRSSASTVDNTVDLVSMKLTLPPQSGAGVRASSEHSDGSGITVRPLSQSTGLQSSSPSKKANSYIDPGSFHPPMYSILIVCPQENTRRTTQDHIQRVLPKSIPTQITTSGDVEACQKMIAGDEPVTFTHIVLQLSSAAQILAFMEQILNSTSHPRTCITIVTDQAQKVAVTAGSPGWDFDQLSAENRLRFLLKPARPYKFAKIFDPEQENALSNDDHTRAEARAKVGLQKEAFKLFKEVLGDKGLRVLAVEDNAVNMQVCVRPSIPYRIPD